MNKTDDFAAKYKFNFLVQYLAIYEYTWKSALKNIWLSENLLYIFYRMKYCQVYIIVLKNHVGISLPARLFYK